MLLRGMTFSIRIYIFTLFSCCAMSKNNTPLFVEKEASNEWSFCVLEKKMCEFPSSFHIRSSAERFHFGWCQSMISDRYHQMAYFPTPHHASEFICAMFPIHDCDKARDALVIRMGKICQVLFCCLPLKNEIASKEYIWNASKMLSHNPFY